MRNLKSEDNNTSNHVPNTYQMFFIQLLIFYLEKKNLKLFRISDVDTLHMRRMPREYSVFQTGKKLRVRGRSHRSPHL